MILGILAFMISRLPKWVWFGSAALTFIAGMINTIGFLGFQHQGVTHLTGSTTLLGIAAAQGDFEKLLHLIAVIGSFLIGCIFGGFLIKDSTLKLGRHYGVALCIESLLLFIAVPFLHHDNFFGAYLASCASGIQNGLASTYSGAVLRTTHVSGLFTDLGITIGHFLRGVKVDWRRMRLYLVLIGSFTGGAFVGGISFVRFSYETLYFPAALTGIVGITYISYTHYRK
jgi:uncharacterized membrane protein YoaK (UPF0700 family)